MLSTWIQSINKSKGVVVRFYTCTVYIRMHELLHVCLKHEHAINQQS